jgi:AcrR family transcriptional regulator
MVSGRDRRHARHEETARLILQAAWRLAERDGLAGLSLGELARAMEMRPQSLYTYFPSKQAIYDAMYKQGFEQLLARNEALPAHADLASFLSAAAEAFVDFAAERPSRYQLLFQRTVPGFVPSEESYAVAKRALEGMRGWLATAGLTAERELDLWRVLLLGLAGVQLANDPGGRRWRQLAGEAARYFVTFAQTKNGDQK